jgi:hypothetical protein
MIGKNCGLDSMIVARTRKLFARNEEPVSVIDDGIDGSGTSLRSPP